MKILTMTYDYHLGGTQRAAQNFSLGYLKFGHEVRAVGINGDGPRKDIMEKAGVIFFEPFSKNKNSIQSIISWQPDVIHLHQAGGYEENIQDTLKQIKLSLPKVRILETNVFSFYNNKVSYVDLHTHLSKWCLWRWNLHKTNKSMQKAAVLPYMVATENFFKITDTSLLNEFKKRHKIPTDKFIYGRVGQKSISKWSLLVVQAFAKLYESNKDIHLVLVGVPEQIKSQIEQLPSSVKSAITVLDYFLNDQDLNLIYNCFDVFVLTSFIGESFGMVMAESLLAETPVVALSTPDRDNSQVELVHHGKAGLIAKDFEGLVLAMRDLKTNFSNLDRMGKYGRDHILKSYSTEVLTPVALSLMQTMIDKTPENWDAEFENGGIKTKVSDDEIRSLYQASFGKTSWKLKLFFIFPRLFIWAREFYGTIRRYKIR